LTGSSRPIRSPILSSPERIAPNPQSASPEPLAVNWSHPASHPVPAVVKLIDWGVP
jgi:hypothetical protein